MPTIPQIYDVIINGFKYYNTSPQWEQEVGKFLEKYKKQYPKRYYDNLSNDLRHQYASAVLTKETNPNVAKGLGDLNEFFNFNASGRLDTERDQIANSIGRNFALKNPQMSHEQMLQNLYENYIKSKGW